MFTKREYENNSIHTPEFAVLYLRRGWFVFCTKLHQKDLHQIDLKRSRKVQLKFKEN